MSYYSPTKKHIVAVYGSLKKGFGNHRLLSDAKYLGTGESGAKYEMLSFGSFPGLLDGLNIIDVELYEVDDIVLSRLDALEGHPHFYRRDWDTFVKEDGEVVSAQIYTNIHSAERYRNTKRVPVNNKGTVCWKVDTY